VTARLGVDEYGTGTVHALDVALADIDAIVLDIDDTLYLERDYVRSGFEAVGRWAQTELGIKEFGTLAWAAFEAGARGRIFDEVLKSCKSPYDEEIITEMVARYRDHSPDIAMAADARSALERWHGTLALAAITDGPLPSQQAKTTALQLGQWIPLVVFTATLGNGKGKPHPAAFELVQKTLAVSGERCVYVADNPSKDFVAPKQLGWRTVRVRRTLGLHADVENGADIDHEITSFDQLARTMRAEDQPTRHDRRHR
jgi:putative hydrolase of the HAD superfamily